MSDTTEQTQDTENTTAAASAAVATAVKGSKKPSFVIPSDRMTIEKYDEVMRAYAAASEGNGGPVTNKQAGEVLGITEHTIVVSNPWLVDIGALTRLGSGTFEVSTPLKEYAHAYTWKAEDAGEKLKPLMADKWFTKALQPRLRLKELPLEAAIGILAQASNSTTQYKPNLERIIQFMDLAGLCRIEGGVVYGVLEKSGGIHKHEAPPPPPPPPAQVGDLIPSNTPFFFLDRERQRKVTLVAPESVTAAEINKIKAWLDLVLFVDEAKPEQH